MKSLPLYLCLVSFSCLALPSVISQEQHKEAFVDRVFKEAGGKENLPRNYRFVDRIWVNRDPAELAKPLDDRKPRNSYIAAPNLWWLSRGTKWVERGEENAKWLAYGWSLGVLDDPKAIVKPLPDLTDPETKVKMVGIQVSGAIDPAMDLYFDRESMLLIRLDWKREICRFSEPRDFGGYLLSTRCTGYRKNTGKPWYTSVVDEVERVDRIPENVSKSE